MVIQNKKRLLRRAKKPKTIKKKVEKLERRQRAVMKSQTLHSQQLVAQSQSVSTSMNAVLLNTCAQGDDISSRDGNDVWLTSVSGMVTYNAGDSYNVVRTLIVFDKQPDGNAFTQGDLIQGTTPADIIEPLRAIRKDSFKRFKILYDKVLTLHTYQPTKTIRFRIPVHKQIKYTGSAAGIGTIMTGALWLVMISDSTAPSHVGETHAITVNWKG